jgi:hypothetical protein
MSINLNARLDEQVFLVQATSLVALASTGGDAAYVSMKNYARCMVIIDVLNATTVTGGAITLLQATAVAGTAAKALAFTRMLANVDVGAGQTLVETAVTSNTFTTNTTDSKRLRYVLDVKADDLDVANGFDCFRVEAASMANAIGLVSYVLYGPKYSGASPMAD